MNHSCSQVDIQHGDADAAQSQKEEEDTGFGTSGKLKVLKSQNQNKKKSPVKIETWAQLQDEQMATTLKKENADLEEKATTEEQPTKLDRKLMNLHVSTFANKLARCAQQFSSGAMDIAS